MKCRTFSSYISSYLDGRLGCGKSGMIEKHMAECSHCRAELEETENLRKLMATIPEKPLPDALHRKIMGSIAVESMGRNKARKPLYRRRLIPVAAAFFVLFIGLNIARLDVLLLTKVESPPCESYAAEDPDLIQEGSTRKVDHVKDGMSGDASSKSEPYKLYYYTKYGALLTASLTSVLIVCDWIKNKR
ncbi:MAG TPA: zf-HC2 domain-containing protein [Candidatus Atribacteria bacterium]|nr:zf-HC2 domain-containing protein [Candidatus Atribacteria bacterium]